MIPHKGRVGARLLAYFFIWPLMLWAWWRDRQDR
jgi:hypothetical protein